MAGRPLDRVREIALALPEVGERLSHGAPSDRSDMIDVTVELAEKLMMEQRP